MSMSEYVKEIIEKISYYNGTFPKEELQFLLDHREETAPFLMDALHNAEEVLGKLLNEENYFLPFYALLMLAQFPETEAYPLVYKIFSADAETVDGAFNDFITEDLSRVLASVSSGDTTYINKLIEDENVNEFVRSAAIDSWLYLLKGGLKTREEVIRYYKTLFEMPAGEDDFLRGSLVWACLDIRAEELLPEIEKSYAENKVDLMLMGDWEDVQKLWVEEKRDVVTDSGKGLVEDMIGDLESWYCFSDPKGFMSEDEMPMPDFETERDLLWWDSRYEGTFARETPKVGKNEPCPCGSGRKYKKCCMN